MTRTPSSTNQPHHLVKLFNTSKSLGQLLFLLSATLAPLAATQAAIITPIGIGDFSGNESLVDFGNVETGDPVEMQTIGGITFGFTVDGVPSSDATIAAGPGNTNHITIANIEGDASGTLSMVFPSLQRRLGYGWSTTGVPGSTVVELFDASNLSMGTYSIDGTYDPEFIGGFVGVQSSMPFIRAEVTWLVEVPNRFALDNIRFEPIPEPAAIGLALAGIMGGSVALLSRRRLSSLAV